MDHEMTKPRRIAAKGSDQKERRLSARFPIDVSLLASPSTDRSRLIQGRIVDLSLAGVSAVIAAELPVGEVLELKFAPPHSSTAVQLDAVVRSRDSYRYNLEFVRIPVPDQATISHSCKVLALLT